MKGRDGFQVFAAAHQAGDLIGLLQAVHAQSQAMLVAVLAGAVVSAAGPNPAESLSAELARPTTHFRLNYR